MFSNIYFCSEVRQTQLHTLSSCWKLDSFPVHLRIQEMIHLLPVKDLVSVNCQCPPEKLMYWMPAPLKARISLQFLKPRPQSPTSAKEEDLHLLYCW